MKSSLPKLLHTVLGRPLIGHTVQAARDAGAERIIVVVGHGREAVESYLREHEPGDDLEFVVQAEQLGTAHAVRQGQPLLDGFDGHVLIMNGDVPNLRAQTARDFVAKTLEDKHPMGFISCNVPDPTGYGRIVRDADGKVLRNVEHRDANEEEQEIHEINAGFYLVANDFLWKNLGGVGTDNQQGEYFLPDLISVAQENGGVTDFFVDDPDELEGVNNRAQLAQAEKIARLHRNHALMVSGVTMRNPESITVESHVMVQPDVVLEAGVSLRGHTQIASGCVIGQGSIIEDSVLEQDVLVKPYSHIESSMVRLRAQIGPFAHLRPASDIGEDAKVGNFVEIKKTSLGTGSKASHLSYLGDAQIGAGCNIGAGTITCNYDGKNKHQTTLGDGVFIGSNSALVAPLNLANEAYVGAGSTITNDVPAESLAVARGRQRNLEGWVKRKKR